GSCSFPSGDLTRRSAGVSHVFDTTSIYATVLPAGFAGANRRRPGLFFLGHMFSRGRLAQLFFLHAVSPRLAPRFTSLVSSMKRGDPGRQPGIDSVIPFPSMPACAGTAAVRTAFAAPVVCIRLPITVASVNASHVHAASCLSDARG